MSRDELIRCLAREDVQELNAGEFAELVDYRVELAARWRRLDERLHALRDESDRALTAFDRTFQVRMRAYALAACEQARKRSFRTETGALVQLRQLPSRIEVTDEDALVAAHPGADVCKAELRVDLSGADRRIVDYVKQEVQELLDLCGLEGDRIQERRKISKAALKKMHKEGLTTAPSGWAVRSGELQMRIPEDEKQSRGRQVEGHQDPEGAGEEPSGDRGPDLEPVQVGDPEHHAAEPAPGTGFVDALLDDDLLGEGPDWLEAGPGERDLSR